MRTLLMALLTTALLWSGSTLAQQKPALQPGRHHETESFWSTILAQQKPALRLVVEDTDDDATRCGITKSGVDSIAALTLRNNGIQVTTAQDFPFLWVRLLVLPIRSSGGCVLSLYLAVRDYHAPPPKGIGGFRKRQGRADIVLCEEMWVGLAPMGAASTYLSQHLENSIKLCLGKLDY